MPAESGFSIIRVYSARRAGLPRPYFAGYQGLAGTLAVNFPTYGGQWSATFARWNLFGEILYNSRMKNIAHISHTSALGAASRVLLRVDVNVGTTRREMREVTREEKKRGCRGDARKEQDRKRERSCSLGVRHAETDISLLLPIGTRHLTVSSGKFSLLSRLLVPLYSTLGDKSPTVAKPPRGLQPSIILTARGEKAVRENLHRSYGQSF